MGRLTKRTGDGWIVIRGSTTQFSEIECETSPVVNAIVRLAVYEDIGTPEEIERIQLETVRGKHKSPCSLCLHNPPSSADGKPCSMCPACAVQD